MLSYLAGGILVVLALHLLLKSLSRATPRTVRALGLAAMAAFGLALVILLLRFGQVYLASALGGVMAVAPFFRKVQLFLGLARAFRPPVIETPNLRMRFDLMRRIVEGTVLMGEHQGKRLSELTRAQVIDLYDDWCLTDPKAAHLAQLWLNATYGQEWQTETRHVPPAEPATAMTEREARLILGIEDEADETAMTEAYRRLMRLNHPDKGGSAYLAAKINQARETLESSSETRQSKTPSETRQSKTKDKE